MARCLRCLWRALLRCVALGCCCDSHGQSIAVDGELSVASSRATRQAVTEVAGVAADTGGEVTSLTAALNKVYSRAFLYCVPFIIFFHSLTAVVAKIYVMFTVYIISVVRLLSLYTFNLLTVSL